MNKTPRVWSPVKASEQDVDTGVRSKNDSRLTKGKWIILFWVTFTLCLVPFPFSSLETQNFAFAAQLKEIQERGYLTVGVKDNLRPLGFRDAAGNLQGLEIDIAQRLAAELLGKPDAIRFQPVANQDRISAVLGGNVDITIARVTATSSRSRLVDFSTPYYLDTTAFITKAPSLITLKDIAQNKIAVLNNSSTIAIVRYILPAAQLVGVDSYEQARTLLETGAATTFAGDVSVLSGWVQEYPEYRLLPPQLSAEALCVVMPRGLQYEPLRQQINSAINRWKAEGWLQERAVYWGLPPAGAKPL